MSIHALLPEVIDQIAAGEVVERPAHLIKEIVENSLDAGATEIEIDFDQGGRQVRIKDNGQGIVRAELPLALARHATSKIQATADLWRLASYGFRGEALATIAAVSRLQIISKAKGESEAFSLISEFGQLGEVLPQGGDVGTTVMVSELFANVPARLKFLKSEAAETTQIRSVLKALALANPAVSIRVRQRGKLWAYWPKVGSFKARAEQVLDLHPLFEGQGEAGGIRATVAMAPPRVVESTSRQIWILVQNRWVQDRGLQAAVIDAYRSLLMHREFPVAVVKVECEPETVDINIHPAKSAVKFQSANDAFRAVHRAVRGRLESAPWLESSGPEREVFLPPARVPPQLKVATSPSASLSLGNDFAFERVQYSARSFPPNPSPSLTELAAAAATRPQLQSAVESYTSPPEPLGFWSGLQVLGQAHLTYIVTQGNKSFVLIDQHAAHERIAYERLMRAWQGGRLDIQSQLIPLQVNLEPADLDAIWIHAQDLARLGIEIEKSGPTSLSVRSAPALLKDSAVADGLRRFATEASDQGGSFAMEKAISDLCATLACHSVVRAGQPLSQTQMTELLQQMDEFPLSSFCPHGRPVSVEWSWSELEREFGRMV